MLRYSSGVSAPSPLLSMDTSEADLKALPSLFIKWEGALALRRFRFTESMHPYLPVKSWVANPALGTPRPGIRIIFW